MLSGSRNFEGRIHQLVKTNWLASPPLVVAYALAGNININLVLSLSAMIERRSGLSEDIWPSAQKLPVRSTSLHRNVAKRVRRSF
ncbi:aconitase family protein [Shigella boydii]